MSYELRTMSCLYAATPPEMNINMIIKYYGVPVTATKPMRFKIFDAKENGLLLWDSGDMQIDIESGIMSQKLTPKID